MRVIFDTVVPIPIAVSVNVMGFTTNFLIFSLYLKSKVWVLLDVTCSSNSSLTDRLCCCPTVVAVATVTVPFTLFRDPERLSVMISILLSSPAVVSICLKNIVLNPTFSVDNPTYELLNLTQ